MMITEPVPHLVVGVEVAVSVNQRRPIGWHVWHIVRTEFILARCFHDCIEVSDEGWFMTNFREVDIVLGNLNFVFSAILTMTHVSWHTVDLGAFNFGVCLSRCSDSGKC